MKKLENIVVGVDFSAGSENALREAVRIAQWKDANLIALNILDREALEQAGNWIEMDARKVEEESRARLEAHITKVTGDAYPILAETLIGHPFQEILRTVEQHKADVLILGARGAHKAQGQTGSIAAKCVRKAPVDVMLVRTRQCQPFHRVVACVDFSDTSREAAEQAVHIARQDGATIAFLHVLKPLKAAMEDLTAFYPNIPPEPRAEFLELTRNRLKSFIAPFASMLEGIPHSTDVIERASVHRGIVEYLADAPTDLVVLGRRGHTLLDILLLGSTAEKVIHGAPCSVLTIRQVFA